MGERDHAWPLTTEEVKKVLSACAGRGVLVGGQALAFWADHLGVEYPEALASGVTADADFIGDSRLARDVGRRLGWQTIIPSLDDATPQTGKITLRGAGGAIKQVDFLSGVVGLTTKDVLRRAVELEVRGIGRLRVMHPVDVLDSRLQNLHLLPEKRDPAGVAQARLAIDTARAYIRREIADQGERVALKLLERIADIALDIAAIRVFLAHGLDPLRAVPLEEFRTTRALHAVRWPQIEREVRARRRALADVLDQATRSRKHPRR
jgi:hypothetical protein